MKRILTLSGLLVAGVIVVFLLYLRSPLSKRTDSLRIELIPESDGNGYHAALVNKGLLPIFVGRCDTISDAMQPDTTVGDWIQRWEPTERQWKTVYKRSYCEVIPVATVEAKFTRRLIWPGGRLRTGSFFPNLGVYKENPLHAGDQLRFLVFADGPNATTGGLPSSAFTAR